MTGGVSAWLTRVLDPGSLVFDIGAFVGDKTARYLDLGARVVCVEPQPSAVAALERRFADRRDVTIVPAAVGARRGVAELSICSRAPYLSTLTEHWKTGRFRHERWDERVEVAVVTIDELIEINGPPAFCKIDVEGYEQAALHGMTRRTAPLSIEFASETLPETAACAAYLTSLGYRRFNLAFGEGDAFALKDAACAERVLEAITNALDPLAWGDVYAA